MTAPPTPRPFQHSGTVLLVLGIVFFVASIAARKLAFTGVGAVFIAIGVALHRKNRQH